jgi:hypothetical protein
MPQAFRGACLLARIRPGSGADRGCRLPGAAAADFRAIQKKSIFNIAGK